MSSRLHLKTVLVSCCATIAIAAATQGARAADMPAPPPPVLTPVVPGDFNVFDGIEFHAQGEVGILGSPGAAGNGLDGKSINFGSLYEDHLNTPELNQLLMTITKPIDTKATGYAWGFVLQGMYGSDMRFNHYLGIGTYFMGSQRNQLNLIQAYGAFHLPWFTKGGVDVKAGLYSSPMGYETLDPSTSPFYSHSYTYNYGVTFNHTGILTTTHVNDTLDLYLGIDTGNQTTFGSYSVPFFGLRPNVGDPNGAPAGFVGFGLNNLLDGKLTVAYYTHLGPEQSPNSDPLGSGKDMRFYNDGVFTYKINDDWTSVTELAWTHDDFGYGPALGGGADYFGAVETLSYSFGKIFTLNGRGEIARDTKNFFVATPFTNSGIALTEEGAAAAINPLLGGTVGNGTTLGDLTLGLTIKPDVPKPFALAMIRPEVRWDHIFAGDALYGSFPGLPNSGKKDQFTFGGDIVLGF